MVARALTSASFVLALAASIVAGSAVVRPAGMQSSPGTAGLSGAVVDASTKRPLARVRVTLGVPRANGGGVVRTTTTDADGRFDFPKLLAGTYELSADLVGYLPVRYGQKKLGRPGTPIVLVDRQQIKDVRLPLMRGGAVGGTVIDPSGQPGTGFVVWALRRRFSDKGAILDQAGSSPVDDRGQYRIFGLDPGEYLVMAQPPRDASSTRVSGADAIQPQPTDGFAPSFHPGTPSPGQATIVTVTAAEDRSGIDVVLPIVPVVRISGTMTSPTGQPLNAGSVTLIRDEEVRVPGADPPRAYVSDGRFTIKGVVPGPYLLAAVSSLSAPSSGLTGNVLYGFARCTIGGSDVAEVTISVQQGVTVSGRLRFPGGTPPSSLQVVLEPVGIATGLGDSQFVDGRTDAQGRFTIHDVPPGPFRFGVTAEPFRDPSGKFLRSLQSVTYQGRNLTDLLDVGTEDIVDVEITFTDAPTELSGTARDAAGQPLADGTVIAFPADKRLWLPSARSIRTSDSDATGHFQITALPPGEFFVAAVADVEQYQWFDARYLERLSTAASRVTLAAGAKHAVDLRAVIER